MEVKKTVPVRRKQIRSVLLQVVLYSSNAPTKIKRGGLGARYQHNSEFPGLLKQSLEAIDL